MCIEPKYFLFENQKVRPVNKVVEPRPDATIDILVSTVSHLPGLFPKVNVITYAVGSPLAYVSLSGPGAQDFSGMIKILQRLQSVNILVEENTGDMEEGKAISEVNYQPPQWKYRSG